MTALYFNHAGTSWPKPDCVKHAVSASLHGDPQDWDQQFALAHSKLCDFFRIPNTEQLLLTPGCTSALAVGIADLDWQSGDVVLHSQWEHHALHRPLLQLQSLGVDVQAVPVGDDSPIDLEFLEVLLERGRVKLVAVTAASNVTGSLLPIQQVIELAHHYSAAVFIDAAQTVGWVPTDFERLGADMVAFGSHKGLLAPWGIGGLYIAKDLVMKCVSARCEISQKDSQFAKFPRPGYCDVGSADQATLAGLNAAIDWLTQQDMCLVRQERCKQAFVVYEMLKRFNQVEIHTSYLGDGVEVFRAQLPTIAFSVSNIPSSQIATALAEQGVVVGSGLQCAPLAHEALGTEATGVVRISLGIQQKQSEVDQLIACLQTTLTAMLCR